MYRDVNTESIYWSVLLNQDFARSYWDQARLPGEIVGSTQLCIGNFEGLPYLNGRTRVHTPSCACRNFTLCWKDGNGWGKRQEVLQVITNLNMAARECRSFLSRYRSSRSATWWQWPWIVWMWSSEMRTTRTSEHSWISSNFIQVSHKLGTNFITASVAGEWASTSPQIGSEQLREVQLTGRQSQSLSQSAVGVNFSTSLIGKCGSCRVKWDIEKPKYMRWLWRVQESSVLVLAWFQWFLTTKVPTNCRNGLPRGCRNFFRFACAMVAN